MNRQFGEFHYLSGLSDSVHGVVLVFYLKFTVSNQGNIVCAVVALQETWPLESLSRSEKRTFPSLQMPFLDITSALRKTQLVFHK